MISTVRTVLTVTVFVCVVGTPERRSAIAKAAWEKSQGIDPVLTNAANDIAERVLDHKYDQFIHSRRVETLVNQSYPYTVNYGTIPVLKDIVGYEKDTFCTMFMQFERVFLINQEAGNPYINLLLTLLAHTEAIGYFQVVSPQVDKIAYGSNTAATVVVVLCRFRDVVSPPASNMILNIVLDSPVHDDSPEIYIKGAMDALTQFKSKLRGNPIEGSLFAQSLSIVASCIDHKTWQLLGDIDYVVTALELENWVVSRERIAELVMIKLEELQTLFEKSSLQEKAELGQPSNWNKLEQTVQHNLCLRDFYLLLYSNHVGIDVRMIRLNTWTINFAFQLPTSEWNAPLATMAQNLYELSQTARVKANPTLTNHRSANVIANYVSKQKFEAGLISGQNLYGSFYVSNVVYKKGASEGRSLQEFFNALLAVPMYRGQENTNFVQQSEMRACEDICPDCQIIFKTLSTECIIQLLEAKEIYFGIRGCDRGSAVTLLTTLDQIDSNLLPNMPSKFHANAKLRDKLVLNTYIRTLGWYLKGLPEGKNVLRQKFDPKVRFGAGKTYVAAVVAYSAVSQISEIFNRNSELENLPAAETLVITPSQPITPRSAFRIFRSGIEGLSCLQLGDPRTIYAIDIVQSSDGIPAYAILLTIPPTPPETIIEYDLVTSRINMLRKNAGARKIQQCDGQKHIADATTLVARLVELGIIKDAQPKFGYFKQKEFSCIMLPNTGEIQSVLFNRLIDAILDSKPVIPLLDSYKDENLLLAKNGDLFYSNKQIFRETSCTISYATRKLDNKMLIVFLTENESVELDETVNRTFYTHIHHKWMSEMAASQLSNLIATEKNFEFQKMISFCYAPGYTFSVAIVTVDALTSLDYEVNLLEMLKRSVSSSANIIPTRFGNGALVLNHQGEEIHFINNGVSWDDYIQYTFGCNCVPGFTTYGDIAVAVLMYPRSTVSDELTRSLQKRMLLWNSSKAPTVFSSTMHTLANHIGEKQLADEITGALSFVGPNFWGSIYKVSITEIEINNKRIKYDVLEKVFESIRNYSEPQNRNAEISIKTKQTLEMCNCVALSQSLTFLNKIQLFTVGIKEAGVAVVQFGDNFLVVILSSPVPDLLELHLLNNYRYQVGAPQVHLDTPIANLAAALNKKQENYIESERVQMLTSIPYKYGILYAAQSGIWRCETNLQKHTLEMRIKLRMLQMSIEESPFLTFPALQNINQLQTIEFLKCSMSGVIFQVLKTESGITGVILCDKLPEQFLAAFQHGFNRRAASLCPTLCSYGKDIAANFAQGGPIQPGFVVHENRCATIMPINGGGNKNDVLPTPGELGENLKRIFLLKNHFIQNWNYVLHPVGYTQMFPELSAVDVEHMILSESLGVAVIRLDDGKSGAAQKKFLLVIVYPKVLLQEIVKIVINNFRGYWPVKNQIFTDRQLSSSLLDHYTKENKEKYINLYGLGFGRDCGGVFKILKAGNGEEMSNIHDNLRLHYILQFLKEIQNAPNKSIGAIALTQLQFGSGNNPFTVSHTHSAAFCSQFVHLQGRTNISVEVSNNNEYIAVAIVVDGGKLMKLSLQNFVFQTRRDILLLSDLSSAPCSMLTYIAKEIALALIGQPIINYKSGLILGPAYFGLYTVTKKNGRKAGALLKELENVIHFENKPAYFEDTCSLTADGLPLLITRDGISGTRFCRVIATDFENGFGTSEYLEWEHGDVAVFLVGGKKPSRFFNSTNEVMTLSRNVYTFTPAQESKQTMLTVLAGEVVWALQRISSTMAAGVGQVYYNKDTSAYHFIVIRANVEAGIGNNTLDETLAKILKGSHSSLFTTLKTKSKLKNVVSSSKVKVKDKEVKNSRQCLKFSKITTYATLKAKLKETFAKPRAFGIDGVKLEKPTGKERAMTFVITYKEPI